MDNKIELDFVNFKGVDYPYRAIVIFGKTEVKVAGTRLSSALSFCGSILGEQEALRVDEMFCGYVPEPILEYTDEALAEWVEENLYDNEPI
jgi:hypothetical protein